ncbi:MAG TPA: aquaporin [bacterium]|nr:aquaporin [bacterium]HKS89616.1 aquaporin [Stellaceae bacterium]
MDSQPLWKPVLAELIGTFTLIFAGAGAIIANEATHGGVSLLGIALAHGLAIGVMVSALGVISGGHFNPAVTVGFLAAGRIAAARASAYLIAQLAGATLGGLALLATYPSGPAAAAHLGTPALAPGLSSGAGILLEAIGTFFLVAVVFGTAVHPGAPRLGGLAIGLTITMDILAFGPLTGAAVNPARAFGPALVSGAWADQLVYWIGPLIGGGVAGVLYGGVYLPAASK